MTDITKAKEAHESYLLSLPNVIGVCTGEKHQNGQPTGETVVVVLVSKKVPLSEMEIEGAVPFVLCSPGCSLVRTDVREAPMPPCSAPVMTRPVMTGHQIGVDRTSRIGTLGPIYRWRGMDMALTCWHVVAQDELRMLPGPIIQPPAAGRYPAGGGRNGYAIGEIHNGVSPFDGSNVDVASILLDHSGDPVRPQRGWNAPGTAWDRRIDTMQQQWPKRILGFPHHHDGYDADMEYKGERLSFPAGIADAVVGSHVRLVGGTSGGTEAKVFAADLTIVVEWFGQRCTMRNQIALLGDGEVIMGGDSGCAVIDDRRRVVGIGGYGKDGFGSATPIKQALRALHGEEVC